MLRQIAEIEAVGHYAIRPKFSDGHDTGIFSWDYLYHLGAQQADTAAAGIAHLAGAAPPPEPLMPVIRSTLLTGDKPLYLLAQLVGGLDWSSEVREQPPWPAEEKVVAEELGPYLAALPAGLASRP